MMARLILLLVQIWILLNLFHGSSAFCHPSSVNLDTHMATASTTSTRTTTTRTRCTVTGTLFASMTNEHEKDGGTYVERQSTDWKTALDRLDFTSEQRIVVVARLAQTANNIANATTQQQQRERIEATLTWLEVRLGFDQEQLRSMVIGCPSLFIMSLETNIQPKICFFEDALLGLVRPTNSTCTNNSTTSKCEGDDEARNSTSALCIPNHLNENQNKEDNQTNKKQQQRLASLLCDMPTLLEYNRKKRLIPRLASLRAVRKIDVQVAVNETDLLAIATKTDSKFEEWLLLHNANLPSDSKNSYQGNSGTNPSSHFPPKVKMERTLSPTRRGSTGTGHDELSQQQQQQPPSAYVIVSNLQSGGNIGNIVRSASIFGCEECIVVGQRRYNLMGDHGARWDLPRRHVWSHADAREYLLAINTDDNADDNTDDNTDADITISGNDSNDATYLDNTQHETRSIKRRANKGNVRIYGVEIVPDAAPIMRYDPETGVMRFPFDTQYKGAAFMFGNEGQGLSAKQRDICDEFLYIPQTRGGTPRNQQRFNGVATTSTSTSRQSMGSASMNVACAAAVILQAYSTWAGYMDAPRENEKFVAHLSSSTEE